MHPVLAVSDLAAARSKLAHDFGFTQDGNLMRLGTQAIILVKEGQRPAQFIDLPLDHVAMSVKDADRTDAEFRARGALPDRDFTPDGPRDIPDFWAHGVRFTFFAGPEGAPLEFCAKNGDTALPATFGHSHYGIRCASVADLSAELMARGATVLAKHQLKGGAGIVNVAFLQLGPVVLELFDEPPFPGKPAGRWIGLAEQG